MDTPPTIPQSPRNRSFLARLARSLILASVVAIIAMWIYAFGFASRESINRINDRQWSERSEALCSKEEEFRASLQDLTEIDPNDSSAMKRKADIVEKATASLKAMVDRLAADTPADDKGRAIVPMWIDDYRTYLKDRDVFIERLRTATSMPSFNETEIEGVPVSERINKFARENDMRSCQTPYDLSV